MDALDKRNVVARAQGWVLPPGGGVTADLHPGAHHDDRIFGHNSARPILIGMPAITELGFGGRHAG